MIIGRNITYESNKFICTGCRGSEYCFCDEACTESICQECGSIGYCCSCGMIEPEDEPLVDEEFEELFPDYID